MRVETQVPRLFREDSDELIVILSTEDEDDFLDKSSSQGAPAVESIPPVSFPDEVGNSKRSRSAMSSRNVSASQSAKSSRNLRPRNETGISLRRSSSVTQLGSSTDSPVLINIPPRGTSRKVSVKRKLEEPENEPRVRKKLSPPLESSESENATPTPDQPLPGRTSDGKIDYGYYVAKYLNQKHRSKLKEA